MQFKVWLMLLVLVVVAAVCAEARPGNGRGRGAGRRNGDDRRGNGRGRGSSDSSDSSDSDSSDSSQDSSEERGRGDRVLYEWERTVNNAVNVSERAFVSEEEQTVFFISADDLLEGENYTRVAVVYDYSQGNGFVAMRLLGRRPGPCLIVSTNDSHTLESRVQQLVDRNATTVNLNTSLILNATSDPLTQDEAEDLLDDVESVQTFCGGAGQGRRHRGGPRGRGRELAVVMTSVVEGDVPQDDPEVNQVKVHTIDDSVTLLLPAL